MISTDILNLLNQNHLKQREKEILQYRWGVSDGKIHTLEDTANKYGLTRERVRMIESKVLRKLVICPPPRCKRLIDYLDD